MTRTGGGAAIALVAVLLATTACSGAGEPSRDTPSPASSGSASDSASGSASPSATPPPTATPAATAPLATCYALDYAQALAPTTRTDPIDCAQPHTAVTFASGHLDLTARGHLLAVDSRHVQDQVAATCGDALPRFLGGTQDDLRLSLLRAVWFTPTVQEARRGDDTYRCDVIAVGAATRLAPLPTAMKGALADPARRARYALCGSAEPGTPGFEAVLCSAAHTWTAVDTVDFDPGPYPGVDAARERGQQPCEDAARDRADDPLNFTWSYAYPTAEQWTAGQRYGVCWLKG